MAPPHRLLRVGSVAGVGFLLGTFGGSLIAAIHRAINAVSSGMIVIWATWYVLSGKVRDGIGGVITTGVIYADTKAGVAVVHDIPLKSSDGEHLNTNSSKGVTALGRIGFAVIAMALAAPRHQRQGLSWLRTHHSGSKKNRSALVAYTVLCCHSNFTPRSNSGTCTLVALIYRTERKP